MSILKAIFGDPNERVLAEMRPIVEDINNLESRYAAFSPGDLKEASLALRDRIRAGELSLDDALPDAFALCREAAKRTLGQRHFDVQLMGGITLHRGQIAEMRTGEGKTLTSTLATYLNALSGKGVHLVTVNDYLAKRDCAWMGQVYDFLGLSVGCITHQQAYIYDGSWKAPVQTAELTEEDLEHASEKEEGGAVDVRRDETGSFRVEMDYMRPVDRRDAYGADITYGTNNEFGFDFLRDNMVMHPMQMVQRELNYAIIDEVDSILIDEARTPLIISAPAELAAEEYYRAARMMQPLREDVHYNRDEKMRSATFTEEGENHLAKQLGFDPWASGDMMTVFYLESALKAKALYERDKQYIVKGGEVVIIDEFTGRLMHGRRYSEGIHQAIEAKEHETDHPEVELQRESQTLATITFQNLFRLYDKLAGMTGTAATEAEEFSKIYDLEVTSVPTNRPIDRDDLPDRVYKTERAKLRAVIEEIKERRAKGQPILVGTLDPQKNEILGELLRREGVPHELLNAKNHEREGQIIAQAGRPGSVTVATNMAGRGVDIILGGNPADAEDAATVRGAGGLCVIGTERHESRRIDNQLRGRAGRQGDPGVTQFFVSLEDDLMRIFGTDRMKGMMTRLGLPDDVPIEHRMVSKSIESAQKKVEGHHFDMRKHLLEYDDVLNRHREAIYRRRKDILMLGDADMDGLRSRVMELVESEIERVVLFHTAVEDENSWDLTEIYEVASTIFPVRSELKSELKEIKREAGSKVEDAKARTLIIEHLAKIAGIEWDRLAQEMGPVLAEAGAGGFVPTMRGMMLRSIDTLWVQHLDAIDHIRTGIGLQGYGQRDPLVQYKKEAFRMFNELLQLIEKQIVYSVYKVGQAHQHARSLMERRGVTMSGAAKTAGQRSSVAAAAEGGEEGGEAAPTGPGEATEKVGRNDPCPCGSGKKYKKCHGA